MGLFRVGFQVAVVCRRNITSKAFRVPDPNKPPPYDWRNKTYPLWRYMFDRPTKRFDENTKLIVVDGPPAIGKTEMAKELADQLDMLHIGDPTMDLCYINSYGYDLRQLDPKLPRSLQSYDEKKFSEDPTHENAAAFQVTKYQLRYSWYIDALAHILSTGQGVVIERCPWSDSVFMDAMAKHKYISKGAKFHYNEVKRSTIHQLFRPHLVIYLDAPVSKVQSNLAARGTNTSKALTKEFLQDVENNYKTNYLPEINSHAELLIYDWTEPGDVEIIVEDVEQLDFDKYTKYDSKMKDWCPALLEERDWAEWRRTYADEKSSLISLFNVPVLEAPEMWASGEDWEVYEKVMKDVPSEKYAPGFNEALGDTGLLFKTKGAKYESL